MSRLSLLVLVLSASAMRFGECSCECQRRQELENLTFPSGFMFGADSAALQIEGGWDADGRGESMMDNFTHAYPVAIDGVVKNADIACDSYHLYEKDLEFIQKLCLEFYRFSISWSRILPDGKIHNINRKGVEYYDKLIDGLLRIGVQPMVTMLQFDMPQALIDRGGWLNRTIIQDFTDYADLLFSLYGNKVNLWLTINEPNSELNGYGAKKSVWPPGLNGPGVLDYKAGHHLLLAHASVYRLYEQKYKPTQNGSISIVPLGYYCYPKTNSSADRAAAERFLQFNLGWIAHPIFSSDGDYPAVMREFIDRNSANLSESRLPRFTRDEIKFIKGTADFFALNYYWSFLCRYKVEGPAPSRERDAEVEWEPYVSRLPTNQSSYRVKPDGFRLLINRLNELYDYPSYFITENGYADADIVEDNARIEYTKDHLSIILDTIKEGTQLKGYSLHSFMDSYEYIFGYKTRFGIVRVNMSDPMRTRSLRKSGVYYKNLIQHNKCFKEDEYELCNL